MPLASETTLQKMVDIIVRESDPERIILFGSQARGETCRRWNS